MTTTISDRRSQPRLAVEHKTGITFEVKAIDEAAHTFTGLASTWSLDHGGDVIRKGAFRRTLDHWKSQAKQRPIPLIDQHNYGSVKHVLGKMIDGVETDDGLLATFEMVPNDPDADAVFRRLKGGFVTGLSIGYETKHSTAPSAEEKANGVRRYLDEVKLVEVSAVIWGMNANALVDTETAKALLAKKDLTDDERAQLEEVRARIDALLASEEPATDEPVEIASAEKGLAPERLNALRAQIMSLKLHGLATRYTSGPARVGS
jgi:HK97 family phage prohead protease